MDGLEQFQGGDGKSEGMSEAALEAFREQMRAASQQIKKAQKKEQKKKKKEDKLAKIITQLLQKRTKRNLAFLAAKLLALNIPPIFVLSIFLLDEEATREEMSKLVDELQAPETPHEQGQQKQQGEIIIDEKVLNCLHTDDESLLSAIKKEVRIWADFIYEQAETEAIRLLEKCINEEGEFHPVIIEFAAEVLRDYLLEKPVTASNEETDYIAHVILQKIFEQLNRNLDHLKKLREEEFGGDDNNNDESSSGSFSESLQ